MFKKLTIQPIHMPVSLIFLSLLSTVILVIISLWQPTLGMGLGAAIIGWLIYQRYPLLIISLLPATITVGEIFRLVVFGYSYEVSLTEIAIILTTTYFLIEKLLRRDFSFRFTSIGLFLLFYLFLHVISLIWVWDTSRTLIAIRILGFHIILFWLLVNVINDQKKYQKAIWGLPVGSIIIAIQLLITVGLQGGFLSGDITNRMQIITPAGPWVTLSAMIFLSLPLLYAQIHLTKKRQTRRLLTALLLISIVAGFLALGKIEIAGLIIGSIFFWKKSKIQLHASILPIALIIIVLLAGPLLGYSQALWERVVTFRNSDSLEFRLEEWRVGWNSFLKNPWLGVGAGNLKVLFQKKHSCHCATEANNALLHILVEFGIVGLLLFLLFARDILLRLKKMISNPSNTERLRAWGLATSCLMILIISMAEVTFVSLNFGTIFWYLIGLIAASSELQRSEL